MSRDPDLFYDQTPGLYVHVPFCLTKCPYCDFYSVTSLAIIPDWLDALRKEVLIYKSRFTAFDSLYLGGGSPSLLSPRELSSLMGLLFHHFDFAADTEITIEANPDDITPEKLKCYRDMGINRISLGAQSFDDNALRYLKRRHTIRQTEKALEWIRAAGFSNMGMDLMYGFEGQSRAGWEETLRHALGFSPEHLSCYQMTIAGGTPFGKMLAEGRITPVGEEVERDFFLLTSEFLEENGYIHYEISNFAVDEKHPCRHNRKYWGHIPYLGLGPAAHSFLENCRWWNIRSVKDYCRMLSDGRLPVDGREVLTSELLLEPAQRLQ